MPAKPLTSLLLVSKQACDALSKMICAFYGHLNSGEGDSLMKMKTDKSVFTVADGIVQHLLQVHLFRRGSLFKAVVGEEDESSVNISTRPFTVDALEVPHTFYDMIEKVRDEVSELSLNLDPHAYRSLTVFVDPIDGTREFSTGKGHECSICIGFANEEGHPIAGLVYRPIPRGYGSTSSVPAECTWAAGAASEEAIMGHLGMADVPIRDGFLTSNGSISPFIETLIVELGCSRVPSGGAGNKLLMLLEGHGSLYIQDRGVSRWDTCGAQAVIEASGGKLVKLDRFIADRSLCSYKYLESDYNADFTPGTASLTPYNMRDKKLCCGPSTIASDVAQVKPYSNMNGLLALTSDKMSELDAIAAGISRTKSVHAPSFD
jgi:3'(2'), 5'-bisphosphate nucleotidase